MVSNLSMQKLDAIRNFPWPDTIKRLGKFLGISNIYILGSQVLLNKQKGV